jgi:predicted nucleotidyltransferase
LGRNSSPQLALQGAQLAGVGARGAHAFAGVARGGGLALGGCRVGEDLGRVVQLGVGGVRVAAHGREVRVAEILGDQARVARCFSKPRRRGVAQRVRGDVLFNPCARGGARDDPREDRRLTTRSLKAAMITERRRFRARSASPLDAVSKPCVSGPRYRERVFDEAVIAEAGRRLAKAAPPRSRVILFGSHARGEADKHSDLDFLVIEPSVKDVVEETYRLRCALDDLDVFADIVLVSDDEARAWGGVYGSMIRAALAEGRPLAA